MNKLIVFRNTILLFVVSLFILSQIFSCQKTGDSKMEIKKEVYGTLVSVL